ncbi:ABC transporter ATP-binding protein [Brunnivagina elsteri]|uniref:Sugar ABC transporter ATP-binding protein n=1 Tax=Brunnivagina elsteri CCALA 953 TaxID=987040 RepID=A0A2A2TA89_9CYAN|nr:ABC transporter ATP-binding protein [Calothrix elsteri]PAX45875.1 sugar ABC transporter ATP-binding protein [Calothrix elsteri CCALA 953]
MANVRLESIKRRFNNVTAIEDITFEIPDGEFWVLVGPSGCGKSTILRTIAGLENATSGNLYIGEQLVNNIPARQRDVAMVFQNYALYPHMSVAENIAFGMKMRKIDPKLIQQRVGEVARSLSLEHLLDRKPKQLSGGQQQRVALGRAIARQAQVFLLDEPLSNLDAQLRDDTRAELKQLHQALRNTTVYVTHDQVEAMTLADKIVVLNGGQIQQIGEPQTIYNQPTNRMVATFIGNPPMNILPAKFTANGFDVFGQILPVPLQMKGKFNLPTGKQVDLGIRPEYITISSNSSNSSNSLISVEVKVVEPLGRETLIRAGLAGSTETINIQAAGNVHPHPGEILNLALDLDYLFVFDTATGDKLYPSF